MFSGRMADLLNPDNSAYSKDFAFAAPPSLESGGKTGSSLSVDGWVIATNSKVNPDLLFQIMASSVTKKASTQAMPYAYPARTSVVTAMRPPYAAAIKDAIKNGAALPDPYPWFTTMEDASYTPLLKAWAGNLATDKALAACQQAAVKALKP